MVLIHKINIKFGARVCLLQALKLDVESVHIFVELPPVREFFPSKQVWISIANPVREGHWARAGNDSIEHLEEVESVRVGEGRAPFASIEEGEPL